MTMLILNDDGHSKSGSASDLESNLLLLILMEFFTSQ